MNRPLAKSKFGGGKGDRTPDLLIANQPLSQLSYAPKNCNNNDPIVKDYNSQSQGDISFYKKD